MPLDESDKNIIRLAVMEGFEAHRKMDHQPLEDKIVEVRSQLTFWKGALAVFGILFSLALAIAEAEIKR